MKSLKNINWKLFIALLFMGLCPTIYTTIRTNFIGQLPSEWSYSIAGQLTWVNLLYEIINEAIILPLFFFFGNCNKKVLTNKLKTGLTISCGIYSLIALLLILFANPLFDIMAVSTDIKTESIQYIRIEAIANIFGIMFGFLSVALISIGKDKLIYILTITKLILCIVFDTFFISQNTYSLNLGVNGIGYSNILVNIILIIVSIIILNKENINLFDKEKLSFHWTKDFIEIGSVSGIESFVRNIAYILMISRMVNIVGESGTYWVANNFIWGWMLLPVLQLGELIKQEVSTNKNNIKTNLKGYFIITGFIVALWIILIPFYKPFMTNILGYTNVDKLFNLVMVLFVFYIFFAIQNVFDMIFYATGKVKYMLFESVVTNSIYYGICFILYLTNIYQPTLIGIALMFGIGNLFDSIVSFIAYRQFNKKRIINIKRSICFTDGSFSY